VKFLKENSRGSSEKEIQPVKRKIAVKRRIFLTKKEVGREGKGGDVRSKRKKGFPQIPLGCVSVKSKSLKSRRKGGAI